MGNHSPITMMCRGLGPDIVDPRQMDLIRQQAERAAAGMPYGTRDLPAVISTPKKRAAPAKPAVTAPAAAAEAEDPAKAERLAKREAALAKKRAAEGGAPVAEAVAEAPEPTSTATTTTPAAAPAAPGKFDKAAMLEKIRQRKASK
jgi:hypothetical protein